MKDKLSFHMPAEWAPHEATWLTWPKDPHTWPHRVDKAQEAFACMIEALTPHEKVHLLVDDKEAEAQALKILKNKKIHWPHLSFHPIPTVDSWIRDYGPVFVHAPSKGVVILDFHFNAWGNKYESLKADDTIPQKIASLLDLPLVEPSYVLEGGSIDVNGQGSLLTTEQCLLNQNRNPHLSKKEIEDQLKKYLGVTQILWLGKGIEGDDTDGHVDDISRFVSENIIVTALEEDPTDLNYPPLQDNLKRLKNFRNPQGRPFEIVTLPMPGRLEREDGCRLPASYANFYIANQVVLVPSYKHSHDALALTTLQKVFPSRKVVGIDSCDLVWGMGSFHCLTQQQPR